MAPTTCEIIRVRRPSLRSIACMTNAQTLTAPSRSKAEYCHFHSKTPRQASASKPKQVEAMNTVQRSPEVRAEIRPIPSRLSRGVRSANNERVADVKRNNCQTRCSGENPATSPVNRGTNSRPQAPCSRGTIMARLRVCSAVSTMGLVSVMLDLQCSVHGKCAGKQNIVLQMNMLMKLCFEGGQRMVEGLVADARAVGGGISIGCLSDGSQDASRGIVFILHHRNRILDGAKRSRRDRLLSGDCRFHPDQEREQNHLFLHQVCAEFIGEILEEAADL